MTKNLNLRKVFFLALLMLCANLFAAGNGYTPQKREFRGAWTRCGGPCGRIWTAGF